MAVGVWKPFQKGREKLEVPYGCREGSRCLPRGLGGVRRPSWREGRSRKALLESQDDLGGQGEVGRPTRKGWKELGVSPRGPGQVGRSSRRVGRDQEVLLES